MPPNHKHYAIDESDNIVWYYDKKARDAFIKADPRRKLLTCNARNKMHIKHRRVLNEQAQEEDRYSIKG